jgi:hypothetical protein
MFRALFFDDPDNFVARGAMTALSAANNNTIMRRLCTQKVLEWHRDNNSEIFGNPEHSLNRLPREDGEGYMTAMQRLAFYTEAAANGTVAIPSGQEEKISWGQRTAANADYRRTCELKRCALVLQLTTATQELRPLIAATVAELHAHPDLLNLYNRCDARALLSAAQSLLGTVTRTDIQVLQNLRAQLHTRPNALSVNEWVIKLTTTNEALAALSQELRLSPQEIKNMFLATVNSATWTAENAKFQSDLAEKEAGENESPEPTDPTKYRKYVELISRRVANKEALLLLPLPPSAFGVQSAPLPVAAPVS